MRNLIKFGMISQLAMAALGCASGSGSSGELSKTEARSQAGKADFWTTDWCQQYGWYGDGSCDDFCPNRDPDCDRTDGGGAAGGDIDCRAATIGPTCGLNEILLESRACEVAGDQCIARTGECSVVSHCYQIEAGCLSQENLVQGGSPATCPAGASEVSACETDSCRIVRGTGNQCRDLKLCEPPAIDCRAATIVPSCDGNDRLVDETTCQAVGGLCTTTTGLCNVVSRCLVIPDICPQVIGTSPVCPEGSNTVQSCDRADGCRLAWGTGDRCDEVAFCQLASTPPVE